MTVIHPFLEVPQTLLIHAAPDMPPDLWGMTAFVLGLLALMAVIDAFTSRVPDALVLLGLVTVTGLLGFFASWDVSADQLRLAVAAGVVIWGINEAWYRCRHTDALGMGDAKWTMLAVACFGVMPAVFAWGIGAILAAIFIGTLRLIRRPVTHVTFAPFLFIGLCLGLYWLRLHA